MVSNQFCFNRTYFIQRISNSSLFRIGFKNGFCGGTLDDVNGIINLSWLTVRGVTVNKRQFANWT